jgi:hypothetical protein
LAVISYDKARCAQTVRYWWVNQNQTFRLEIGRRIPVVAQAQCEWRSTSRCREVSPGDGIFSFVDKRIAAIGVARSYCWESPKPLEFGEAGLNWENVGWRVKVAFTTLVNKVRPKDHMDVLRALLPSRYSPSQPNGNGIQSIYLTEVSPTFAEVLGGLIGQEAQALTRGGRGHRQPPSVVGSRPATTSMFGSTGWRRGQPPTPQSDTRIGRRSSRLGADRACSSSA